MRKDAESSCWIKLLRCCCRWVLLCVLLCGVFRRVSAAKSLRPMPPICSTVPPQLTFSPSTAPQALAQTRNFLQQRGIAREGVYDTAGAAQIINEQKLQGVAAVAS